MILGKDGSLTTSVAIKDTKEGIHQLFFIVFVLDGEDILCQKCQDLNLAEGP